MDPERQKLTPRAKKLNTASFPEVELQGRAYLIEAEVDVDRLLSHEDWRVRSSALSMVAWGLGATDGVDRSIEILVRDPNEDVRAEAEPAWYEVARGTPLVARIREVFRRAADADDCDYARDTALRFLRKIDGRSSGSLRGVN